jgi:hypothetical protein
MADEILTIREVAELLKINEKTAYSLACDSRCLADWPATRT